MEELKKLEEQLQEALDNKTNLSISVHIQFNKLINEQMEKVELLRKKHNAKIMQIENEWSIFKNAYKNEKARIKNKLIIN